MIKYTCAICEEEYPFEYTRLIDNQLVCSQCLWNELWRTRDVHKFKKRKDPRQPVLDLIDRLQDEVGHASGGEPYDNIYSAMEVHDILNEIQQAVEAMGV
ncbi:hypothetical protein [Lactococcus phage PMBT68]|nr:hypothetical protein [Lactococcus phage P1411]